MPTPKRFSICCIARSVASAAHAITIGLPVEIAASRSPTLTECTSTSRGGALGHLLPKTSVIFHHKPETPEVAGYSLLANPFGFADWFKLATPLDHAFAKAFADRAMDSGLMVVMDRAEAIPVPDRKDAHQKSKAVIALQLLKRARNVAYNTRQNLRRPPSVMMAKLVADAANQTTTLTEEVLHQAQHLHALIDAAHRQRQAVEIRNPHCDDDSFTDRWPGSLREQELYLRQLKTFIGKMAFLGRGRLRSAGDAGGDGGSVR